MLTKFTLVRPRTIKEAIAQLAAKEARIHAGGTDLMGCLRDKVFSAARLVSISQIETMRGIRRAPGGGVRIGALTTITEIAGSKLIQENYSALAMAAAEVASPQLRNQGTIGGNLCQKPRCWYYRGDFHCLRKAGNQCYAYSGENQYHSIFGGSVCFHAHPSDTAPALMALEASVRLEGKTGARVVPLEKFFVLPQQDVQKETILARDEMVTEIILPRPVPGPFNRYRKIRARGSWDFALAGAAIAVQVKGGTIEKARVVLSGAAPIPWRSKEVEEVLAKSRLDQETIGRAAEAAVRNAAPLRNNGYKIPLFKGIVEEELTALSRIV